MPIVKQKCTQWEDNTYQDILVSYRGVYGEIDLVYSPSLKINQNKMRTNIQMMRNPFVDKLKEDKEAEYNKTVYKNIPLLAAATLVALPITFFILMWIVNKMVELTQLIYAL